jgi:hypothetical protein
MFRELRVSCYEAPSLKRGLVQLFLVFTIAVTPESESRRNRDHNLLSHMRLPLPEGPHPRIGIAQLKGASYNTQGCDEGTVVRLHTGYMTSVLIYPTEITASHKKNAVFCYVCRVALVRTNVSKELRILMMEAPRSSETPVLTKATRRKISEDGILHSHRRKNLTSYIALTGWTL